MGLIALVWVVVPAARAAEDKADLNLVNKIRDEGMNRSKVMDTLGVLTDEIGPRLTGSPGLKKASEWTRGRLTEYGLQNVRAESFAPFGRGWTLEHSRLRMVEPLKFDIPAFPKAWTPGTNGVQRAKVMYAKIESEEDLAKWKGKLAGMIVLRDPVRVTKPHFKGDATRIDAEEMAGISKIELAAPPTGRERDFEKIMKQRAFEKKLIPFFLEEKVLATLNLSRGDDGTIFVQGGGSYKSGEAAGPPNLVVQAEVYNRLFRLVEKKKELSLELDVQATFHEEDPDAAVNVLADWPGSDKKDEIVMLGGHLDSWHAGTGATDNAAGVAVSMEALRILKAIGFKPRRTIRIGLWGGEEQGLLGSRAFVKKWLATRPEPADPKQKEQPSFMQKPSGPLSFKPLHGKVSAYFNLDGGSGKIRGVYGEGNVAIKPIFDAWLAPFNDMGATTVTMQKTGGTDHQSFDNVGIPGFQFIQDELDYFSRTHHSNLDVYDKVQKGDLMQAAIIMASFVAHTANRDEMLPRKPLPQDPPKGQNDAGDKPADKAHH
jgi:CBS domain-containing protein